MTDLGPRTRALLDAAEGCDDATPMDRARVRSAVRAALLSGGAALGTAVPAAGVAKIAAATAPAVAAGSAVAPVTSALGGAKLLQILLGVAVMAGVAVSASRLTDVETPPPATSPELVVPTRAPSPSLVPAPKAPSPAPPAAPTGEHGPPWTPRKRFRAAVVPRAPSVPAEYPIGPELAEELSLLRQAKRALQAGDAGGALAKLDDHRARFAASSLRPEEEALRVHVLCDLDRVSEARRTADALLARDPSAPQARAVRSSCAFRKGERP